MHMPIAKRVEIAFWDLVIPALSDSIPVRQAVYIAYQLWRKLDLSKLILLIGLVALAGLFSGASVYLLTLFLF